MKKFIVAWNHAQARHYAQMQEWPRSDWTFVGMNDGVRLKGLRGVIVIELRAPRYRPSHEESMHHQAMADLLIVGHQCGHFKLNVATLP